MTAQSVHEVNKHKVDGITYVYYITRSNARVLY